MNVNKKIRPTTRTQRGLTRLARGAEEESMPASEIRCLRVSEMCHAPNAFALTSSLTTMIGRIIDEHPDALFILTGKQLSHVALIGDRCVGLSIIDPDGDCGVDSLTWVDREYRHRCIATELKRHALRDAREEGYAALWVPGDSRSASFYASLGLIDEMTRWISISRMAPSPRLLSIGGHPRSSNVFRRQGASMSIEENKAVVGRWFTEFWGEDFNPAVIDELAAPDIRFHYSLHDPMSGRDEVRDFITKFRTAFPDLNFWGTADLIAEGDYVVGQWEGGGTHTGPIVFDDLPIGSDPAASGKTMRFTGMTVLKVVDGLIVEEIGIDDGVKVLQQLGIIPSE